MLLLPVLLLLLLLLLLLPVLLRLLSDQGLCPRKGNALKRRLLPDHRLHQQQTIPIILMMTTFERNAALPQALDLTTAGSAA